MIRCRQFVKIINRNEPTAMARQRAKSDFPTKNCPTCGLPFTWRKKWADCWDEVKYCSERCRRRKTLSDNTSPNKDKP
jgi:hypothetical protein